MFKFESSVCLQHIRVQTGPETVESATLHIVELGANAADMRISAMHHQSPLHNFLFDRNGKLLHANRAAVQACRRSAAGDLASKCLFCVVAGIGQLHNTDRGTRFESRCCLSMPGDQSCANVHARPCPHLKRWLSPSCTASSSLVLLLPLCFSFLHAFPSMHLVCLHLRVCAAFHHYILPLNNPSLRQHPQLPCVLHSLHKRP